MRVLWVKAGKLLPVNTGGKIRSYNLLRHLAAHHELVLLSYYGGARDVAYEREIRRHFPGADPMAVDLPYREGRAAWIDYARGLFSSAPYAVTKFTATAVSRKVARCLADQSFDVAVCDFLSASLNFPAHSATPTVLFQHNVESVLWRRQAAHEPDLLKRLAFTVEAAKMSRYERATIRRFPHVIAVSEQDRRWMIPMTEPERISVVSTGVDVREYRAAAGIAEREPIVMFLGSMDWEPNIDAVDYFSREIWPAVRAAVPSARFRIVGRAPDPRVLRLASESIEVTGTVPSVVDHLKETAVFVVPLRIGGGTRLKIFEAMAAERAVVSTSIGAEGLAVAHGRDIVLADTAGAFADAVIGLLRDRERRNRLARGGSATAARHDWSSIARDFEQVLARAVASSTTVDELAAHSARVGA